VIVQNGSESSLVSDVKTKQDLDLIMIELKKLVPKKAIEVFSHREMVWFATKVSCLF